MTSRSWWLAVVLSLAACKDSDFDGVRDGKDCSPDDRGAFPGAKEVCDGIDNDCDGQIDEDVTILAYLDRDGDGAGDPDFFRRVCVLPDNGVEVAGDCDDFDAEVREGLDEVCDGKDNDCDDDVDEGVTTTYFPDGDGDGHGVAGGAVEACAPGPGVSTLDDDCDDADRSAYPGAPETCDGVDDDCDGQPDEDLPIVRLWEDRDGDGFGDPARPTTGCGPAAGVSDNALDCDDADPTLSPDAIEARGNGADDDCDGFVDEYGVGPGNEFATVADAVRSAPNGSVVQLDAGLFLESVDLRGRDLTLAGEGCGRTTLYGDSAGSTVSADAGRVTRLTISGGIGTDIEYVGPVGGGVFVEGDVTLSEVCLVGNTAEHGGGIGAVAGHLVIEDSLVTDNAADWSGGGVWAAAPATLELKRSRVVGNRSLQYGGGLAGEGLVTTVTNTVFAGNRTWAKGGAVFFDEASDGIGGQLESLGTFDHLTFHDNATDPTYTGTRLGEAILAVGSQVVVTNSLFTGHGQTPDLVEGQHDQGTNGNVTLVGCGFRGNAGADKDLDLWFLDRQMGEPRYVDVDPDHTPAEWDLRLADDSDFLDAGAGAADPDASPADLGAYGGPDAPAGWDFGWTVDDDGDGALSAREMALGTDRWVPDATEDPDQDGIPNGDELLARTDPFSDDTDRDGVTDDEEAALGTDPRLARDHAPAPDAGPLVRLAVTGSEVPLDGSASVDPDGDALSFAWSVVSKPATSVATLASMAPVTTFVPDVPGTYVLALEVGDGGATRTATLEVRARDGFVVPDDFPTLAAALGNAVDGEAVGLRAGTYGGALDLSGRDLWLVGLAPARADVVLEGWGQGTTVRADGGSLRLGSLVVQGGRESEGGGVSVTDGAALGLHDVIVAHNHALTGGGLFASSTPIELTDTWFEANAAAQQGGHVNLLGDDHHDLLQARRVAFVGGEAPDGAALFFDGNDTDGDNDAHLDGVIFAGNAGDRGVAWRHRGLGSDLRVEHALFVGNSGTSLTYTTEGREVVLSSAMAQNAVTSIVDGNTNGVTQGLGAIWTDLPPGAFGNPAIDLAANAPWIDAPLLLTSFVDDGDPASDVFSAKPGSPIRDGGFVERVDADGSRSDASACGGPTARAACALGWRDLDGDGLPDAWELAFGTDPASPDAGADPDGDGIANGDELALGTRPDRADTDLDGLDDDVDEAPTSDRAHRPVAVMPFEVVTQVGTVATLDGTGSTDPDGQLPLTYSWRLVQAPQGSLAALTADDQPIAELVPDQEGAYRVGLTVTDAGGAASREREVWVVVPQILDVPGEFATIEEAYAAALPGDTIRLGAGEFEAFLDVDEKAVTVVGAGADLTTMVGTPGNPVVFARGPELTLRDLTLAGGSNQNGGGLRCDASPLTLDRVVVRDNVAYTGGGMYLFECDTLLRDSVLLRNHASYNGGAVYADSGSLRLERTTVAFNESDASSGGLLLLSVDAELQNVVLHGNAAEGSGAALFIQYQTGKLFGQTVADHLTVVSNRGSQGAVHRLDSTPVTLTNSVFVDNGTYALYDVEPTQANLVVDHNGWFSNTNHTSPSSLSGGPTDLRGIDLALAAVDLDGSRVPARPDQDLRLRERSPAIDAGAGPADPDGSAPDLGAGGGPLSLDGWDAYLVDSDGDGMADVWESEHGLDPAVVDGFTDRDGDGLTDRAEFPASFPDAADTDGDGFTDDVDAAPADPYDQAPKPNAGSDTIGTVGLLFSRTATATDPQSQPVSYAWTFVEVPPRSLLTDADLGGAATATVSFTPDTGGLYVLGVVASDGFGVSPAERLEVRVPGALSVPGDYPDLASAVDAATTGTSIDVAPGVWPCRVDLDGASITLTGAGAGVTILDGEGQGRVVKAGNYEDLVLEGVTLTGGVGGRGGALLVTGGSADLFDVDLLDNVGTEGGAIYLSDAGAVTMSDVVGGRNVAGMRGGLMMATGNSSVSAEAALFAQNVAPDDQGGVFRIYQSTLDLTNAVLHDNVAEEGGGVYVYGSSSVVDFDHVTATHNDGTTYGAVVRMTSGAQVNVTNSLFTANEGHSVIADTSSAGVYGQSWTLVDGNTTGVTYYLTLTSDPLDGVGGNLVDAGYAVDFVSLSDDGDFTNDDLHLLPTSDAVDAGDPASGDDPDASLPDLGAYGGPGGAW